MLCLSTKRVLFQGEDPQSGKPKNHRTAAQWGSQETMVLQVLWAKLLFSTTSSADFMRFKRELLAEYKDPPSYIVCTHHVIFICACGLKIHEKIVYHSCVSVCLCLYPCLLSACLLAGAGCLASGWSWSCNVDLVLVWCFFQVVLGSIEFCFRMFLSG